MLRVAASAQETTPEAVLTDTIRAQFVADTFSPLVGEPVDLTLIADLPAGATLVQWPDFSDTWGDFVVQRHGALETTGDVADGQRLRQRLTVILWEPGDYETPETLIGYRLPGVTETYFAPFTPVFFSVPSVLDQTDLVLRPLRDQVSLFYLSPLVIGGLMVTLLVAGYGGFRLWRRWQSMKPKPVEPVVSPSKRLLDLLHRLNDDSLAPDYVVIQACNAVRAYIAATSPIRAEEMTTGETIDALTEGAYLSGDSVRELERLLELGDLVKFTRMQVTGEDSGRFLSRAYRWVVDADEWQTRELEVV